VTRKIVLAGFCCLLGGWLHATDQPPGKQAEKSVTFVAAKADPHVGDWQNENDGSPVAQVSVAADGSYRANLLKGFDSDERVLAVLSGSPSGDSIAFTGDGWTATIENGRLAGSNGSERIDLRRVTRSSPTLDAKPPAGAVVLFDGSNLDAWATKAGKEWLKPAGPAAWKLIDGGAVEVVPGADSIITRKTFGDCHVHAEFRTLGSPTNSGVYLQARYEVNVSETYGKLDGNPTGSLDNCTDKVRPRVRASLPPLTWQTLDIDFRAPRFDADGKKTAAARATVLLNGVKIYDDQELNPPRGAAGRLGEASTGPLMLQEHGAPLQFRDIWVQEVAR
jgi:hypothetical protein